MESEIDSKVHDSKFVDIELYGNDESYANYKSRNKESVQVGNNIVTNYFDQSKTVNILDLKDKGGHLPSINFDT